MLKNKPENVIRFAVKGMLPKNRLRPELMKKLKLFRDAEHTHSAQQPTLLELK